MDKAGKGYIRLLSERSFAVLAGKMPNVSEYARSWKKKFSSILYSRSLGRKAKLAQRSPTSSYFCRPQHTVTHLDLLTNVGCRASFISIMNISSQTTAFGIFASSDLLHSKVLDQPFLLRQLSAAGMPSKTRIWCNISG